MTTATEPDAADAAAAPSARTFPRGASYMEALQDPASAFADPELAAAAPALTPLGLPRPVSGNFAAVFRMDAADGRAWAVRCFTRWFDDMGRRYEAVDAHLQKQRGTWRVGFEFQSQGVHVDGEWYPIVKMDWTSGQPLLGYIEQHLWDGAALAYLAHRFATLVDELRRAGVAHGDLQHGNILVVPGGDLRLVDYDGMFVPALAGLTGNELGHRNYQHPSRAPGEFGLHIDNFSSWVVYASLVGLSVDPLLWGRVDGGDECLLFRSQDFTDPVHSDALAAFESSGHPVLVDLAGRLRAYLAMPLASVPPLAPDRAPMPVLQEGRPVDLARQQSLMAVLRDEAPAAASSPLVEDIRRPRAAARPPVHFSHPTTPRLAAGAVAGAVLLVLVAMASAVVPVVLGLPALVAVTAVGSLAAKTLWRQSPEVAEFQAKQAGHAEATRRRDEAKSAVAAVLRQRAEVDKAEHEALSRAGRASEQQQSERDAAIRQVDDQLRVTLTALAAQEQELYRAEHTALAAALRDAQRVVIDEDLRRKPLSMYSGLDDRLLFALALDDVRTAADFVDVFVENEGKASELAYLVRADDKRVKATGLSAAGARQLLSWRRGLEARLSASLPTSLPDDVAGQIRARFSTPRAELAKAEGRARADAERQADAVRAMPVADSTALTAAARQAQRQAAQRRVKLDQDLGRAKKALAEAEWEMDACERELDAYRGLTFAAFLRGIVG
ncbi:MAG: hypothetical protein QOI20_2805, partial [Acidimicrobiaceae bacterium]|nr:hypothetical protein [Acidimicrobiaceae bacterium]